MMFRPSSLRSAALPATISAALCALVLLVGPGEGFRSAEARGGAAPVQARPDPRKGAQYFDQAIRWVNDGKTGIHRLTDFYADLANVKMSVEGRKNEGFMRLWLKAPTRANASAGNVATSSPGKYRIEIRPQRQMARLTTKILDGEKMWIIHPNKKLERMHGRPGGADAVRQAKSDRRRLMDLASFLTLEGLKGPSVTFINEGLHTGNGDFAGTRIRVRRKITGGPDVVFYLDFVRDAQDPSGKTLIATSPGIVKVEGDPRRNEPTEYYILDRWKRGPQFRYPGRIQAFTSARPGAKLNRFLLAFPNDIRINTRLPDSTFAPPR